MRPVLVSYHSQHDSVMYSVQYYLFVPSSYKDNKRSKYYMQMTNNYAHRGMHFFHLVLHEFYLYYFFLYFLGGFRNTCHITNSTSCRLHLNCLSAPMNILSLNIFCSPSCVILDLYCCPILNTHWIPHYLHGIVLFGPRSSKSFFFHPYTKCSYMFCIYSKLLNASRAFSLNYSRVLLVKIPFRT